MDYKFHDLEWTEVKYSPERDNTHFIKAALTRGIAELYATGITPFHSLRAEYEGMVYYGTADKDGNATLTALT